MSCLQRELNSDVMFLLFVFFVVNTTTMNVMVLQILLIISKLCCFVPMDMLTVAIF